MAAVNEGKSGGSKKPETSAPRTKVVIRRLPPTLPEETFWRSVESWVTESTCLWKRYVKGKPADLNDGHAIFSRAYVLLSAAEVVTDFHRGYDGHVFRSKSGEEFQAVVELAPVQKTPYKVKIKVDARQGTIDTEPDYLSFLESLKTPPEKPVLEVTGPTSQPTTTPLLEHLRTHGRSGKGSKGKDKQSTSSSDATARRAIASVNAAAAKRAQNANSGPILVAGKGRATSTAVHATKTDGGEVTTEGGEGKKKRNRNKGKQGKPPGEGGGQAAVQNQTQTSTQSQSQGQQSVKTPRAPRSDWAPPPEKPKLDGDAPGPGQGKSTTGRGGGGGGRNNRGGGGGGGRGGGVKGEGGKDRTPRGAVTSILTKNAEGESTRGGAAGGGGGGRARGRGRGRGGGGVGGAEAPTIAAASARIDG